MGKKKVKIDWKIMAFADECERQNSEAYILYQTKGYAKFGYGEIECVGRIKNSKQIMNFINTFGRMLAEGERFQADAYHSIYDADGNLEFRFWVFYGIIEGKKCIYLFPDFEQEIHDEWKATRISGEDALLVLDIKKRNDV